MSIPNIRPSQNLREPHHIPPITRPNLHGIGNVQNSMETISSQESSCGCTCFDRIRSFFTWLFDKIFSSSTLSEIAISATQQRTPEDIINDGQRIQRRHLDFLLEHVSYPSKTIVKIELDNRIVAVIKNNLGEEADFARLREEYETALRNTLQAPNLTGSTRLTMTSYLFHRIDLTPEQIQGRERLGTFLYNISYKLNTPAEDGSRDSSGSIGRCTAEIAMNFVGIQDQQRRNEIQEFLN